MGGPWEQYQKSPPGPWTSFQPQPENPIDTSGIDAEDISAVTGRSAQGGKPWDRAIVAKDGEIAKRALGDAGYTDYSNPKNLVDRYEGEKKRRAGEPSIGNDRPDARDDWLTMSRKFFNKIGPYAKQSAAGFMQGAAEIGAMQPDVPQAARDTIEKMGREGRIPGQSLYRMASEDIAANQYNVDEGSFKYYTGMLADSMVQMVPAIAATLLTESPAAGMATMGGQVWGQQYGESRADGRSSAQSFGDASFMAASEVIGEEIPLGMMMKPGGTFLKRTLKQMGAEGLQETFTQVLQTGYDMGVLHPDMTWGEALKQVRDAGIVGAGMGGGMAVAGDAFNRATGRTAPVAPDAPPANLTPSDLSSPLPNDLLSLGKSELDKSLAAAAAPAGVNVTDALLKPPSRDRERPKATGLDRIVQITIQTESNGNRNAVSPKGAKSEMQVMDATNSDPGYGVKPAQNDSLEERARVGRDYIAAMLRKYGGDPSKAWAAYNMGPGGFDAILKQYGEDWLNHVPDETRGYVLKNLNRLGGEGFDAEGAVRPIDTTSDDFNFSKESASDYLRRVLGEDVFNTESAPAPTDLPPPTGDIAGEPISKEWTAFSPDSGSLGIPRDQMPQIAAEVRGALVNFLNARGIKSEQLDVPAATLKPTQAEFSPAKVQKAIKHEGGDRAILVSNDGYVLDGHHQWLAKREQGQDVKTQRLDASIRDLLNVVPEFPSAETAGGSQPGPTPSSPVGSGISDLAGPTPQSVATNAKIHPRANDLDAELLTFIAANGGINDNGGHSLRSKRNLQRFIPGIGSLIRPTGKSIDQMRERMVETGWINDNATEADVLEMIERAAMRGNVFHPGSNKQGAPTGQEPESEARGRISAVVSQIGLETFGETEMGYALEFVSEGYPEERAIWAAMERAIMQEFAISGAPTTEKANGQESQWVEVKNPFTESGSAEGTAAQNSNGPAGAEGQAGPGGGTSARPDAADQGGLSFKDTASGKGFTISGLSEDQQAAIAKAVPKASGAPAKSGGITYSKKHEVAIREVLKASSETQKSETDSNNDGPDRADIVAVVDANNQVRNAGSPWREREAFRVGAQFEMGIRSASDAKVSEMAAQHNEQFRAGMTSAKAELRKRMKSQITVGDKLAGGASVEEAAKAARARATEQDPAFDAVWTSAAFKKVAKELGSPHRESPVAAGMVRGWLDGKAGDMAPLDAHVENDAFAALVAKIQEHPSRGANSYNPVDSYVEGFYAAVMGEPREIRTVGSAKTMGVAQAIDAIDAKLNPQRNQDDSKPKEKDRAITESEMRSLRAAQPTEDTPVYQRMIASMLANGRVSTEPANMQMNLLESVVKRFPQSSEGGSTSIPRASGYGSKNKIVNDDRAAQARERIKAAMNRVHSGIDPELLAEGVILATYHIEAGARKFADFAKAVSDDLGKSLSELRPYLRAWYQGAQAMLEDGGEDVADMDGPGAVRAAMSMIEDESSRANPVSQKGVTSEKAVVDSTTQESSLRDRIENSFRTAFEHGRSFDSITAAREYVRSTLGETIKPGTAEAKIMDEAIESAVIYTARQIAVQNEGGPEEIYRRLVDLYNAQPKLSVRSSTSIEQQAYSTPIPLAYLASHLAGINQNTTVYEPTAGNGALLIDARPTYVTANELNPDRAAQLRGFLRGATITEEDAAEFKPQGSFDVVIGNPPFGAVRDDTGQSVRFQVDNQYSTNEIDHAIAMKALESMKDDGSATLIVGGINKTITDPKKRAEAYNGKAKREFYFKLYSQYNVVDHFTVDGALYERQGAGWPVDVIVIKGRGKSNIPLPAIRAPRQYASWDALAEVLNARPTQNARPTGTTSGVRPAQEQRQEVPDVGAAGVSGERGNNRRAGLSENVGPGDVRSGSPDGQSSSESLGEPSRPMDQAVDDQRGSGASGRDPARVNPEVAENDKQVAYHPGSNGTAMGTLVPVNMQTAVSDALDNLAYRVGGDIDAFVADRLGYDQADMYSRFGAEQIDAIALSIDNIERGAGFIIGDQTGIGKGRVVAAIIRYAIRQGRSPVFVTEKPTLYADMYRDMTDIGMQDMLGRDINIMMSNASQSIPLNDDGSKVLKSSGPAKHTEMLNRLAAKGLKAEGVDALFTTYSQMQTLKGQETERQRAIRAIATGGVLILDESHNAGGSGSGMIKKKGAGPNRAEFVRELVGLAHGVFYSSATYAKRPDVMDLYAATDMRLAVDDMDKLADAIAKGGVPMQQVVAAMLSRAGQYVRRERSFDGIAYNTPIAEVDRETYGQASSILKAIQDFSENYVKDATEAVKEEIKTEAETVAYDGSLGAAGARSTNFTAIMHNVINQMLLAFKADDAAQRAIAAIERGEKPVVTASNTLETLLEEYAEDNDISVGQEMNISFADVFRRYLERSRWITIKKPFSEEKGKQVRLTDAQLGAEGARAFREGMKLIAESKLDQLPGSPIDYILSKIEAAGYKTAEITGRTHGLNYRDGIAYLKARPMFDRSAKGKIASIRGFNDGSVDAIFLNRSGSTGLSLHASEKFKDQRKRRMILAQAEGNIDTHMQMLGRVHRTGQVVLPEYDQLVAGIPAEKRPAAVLAKKMASLNANTTASRDSALTSKEVIDFMNEYGDEVVARIMADEPEIHTLLGDPLTEEEEGYDKADAARRVTGRIPLLPVDMQDALYQRIEDEYRALLEQKDAAGENALEAKTFDLKAETLGSNEAVAPVHGSSSPFADGVYVERVSTVRLGKPYRLSEVVARVAASLGRDPGDGTAADLARVMREGQQTEREEWLQAVKDSAKFADTHLAKIKNPDSATKQREKFTQGRLRFQEIRRAYVTGNTVRLTTPNGNLYGIITSMEKVGKAQNPTALGSWQMGIALVDASRHIAIPFSQIALPSEKLEDLDFRIKVEHSKSIGLFDIVDAFDNMQTESREERSIVTGNLLSGFDYVNGRGTIINYTTADGGIKQGIMLSRGFNFEKHHATRPIALTTPEVVVEWLKESGGEITGQGSKGKIAVLAIPARDAFVLTAPKSKSDGGEFFLNKRLTAAMGGDFVSKSNGMVASSSMAKAPDAIGVLLQSGVKFEIPAGASDEVKTAARALVEKYAPRETRKVEEAKPATLAPDTAQPARAMTQQQRGEMDARQQQGMARRGGQESVKDQAGGLFSAERDQGDMFDRRESRRSYVAPELEQTFARRKELWKHLNERLKAMGIGDKVMLRVVDRIASGAFGDAGFTEDGISLIRIAMTGYEDFVLDHEVIHILRDFELFRPAEWAALAKAAQANTRLMKSVEKSYPDLSGEALIEEAVADMFAEWRQGRLASSGFARVAMQRILSFFDSIRRIFNRDSALKAEAQAVMQRIDSGEIGSRDAMGDPRESVTRESRAPSIVGDGKWDGIRERLDVWRTNMQDRMLPLLRTQQRIELQSGKTLAEGMNPYLAEELMSGKVGAKLEHLADDMVGPMFEQIKAEGLTVDEVETYLYARHAPERNARISEINSNFGEGTGSGMTDAEAQSIMERVDMEGKREALDRVAQKVDKILSFAINTRVEAGLLSQEEADAWADQYQHYVPLRGRAEINPEGGAADYPRYGSGINVRGPESKRAFGRESRAADILAYTIMQAEEAVVRAGRNEVAQAFYRMVKANPDPDMWSIQQVRRKPTWNKALGQVVYRNDSSIAPGDEPFTVSLKIDGSERRVTLNRDNPAAVRLASAMRNLEGSDFGKVTQFLSAVNRYLSFVNTGLNPEFVITNAFRDIQTASVNLAQFDLKGLEAGALKDYPAALKASIAGAFKKGEGEWSKWYQEFIDEGGRVYFNQVEDLNDIRRKIERTFTAQSGTLSATRTGLMHVKDFIENANNGVENSIRLSAYKNARERGMSKAQAASLAKNLTVNFNRRGTWGPVMNSLYLFYNASIQGTARMMQAAFAKGQGGKRVRRILGGMIVGGMMLDILNMMLSGDDDDGESYYDKISEFDKSRNLIIMIPGSKGEFFKIPLPYGYNAFFSIGRAASELSRGKNWAAVGGNLFGTIADAFNPVGGNDDPLKLVSPTLTDPLVDIVTNTDFAGRPIMPEDSKFGPERPDSQKYWGSVSPHWRVVTDLLNSATGGDEVVPGKIDISPETLEHLSGIATGAAGAFFERSAGLVEKTLSGEEIDANDLPLVRKLVGSKPSWYDKSAYYARTDEIEQVVHNLKEYANRGDVEKYDSYALDKAQILSLNSTKNVAEKTMRAIKKARGQLDMAHDLGSITSAEYRAEKQSLDDQQKAVISEFNRIYLETVDNPTQP